MYIIEKFPQNNPNQHTEDDTLTTLNLTFHYKTTQTLVAAIAHIATIDRDGDNITDAQDNCPALPNGPALGTCISEISKTCTGDYDCVQGACSMHQEDSDADGKGDVCSNAATTSTTTTTIHNRRCPARKVLGPHDPRLENLRDFRDNTLAQSAVGRTALQIYYDNAGSIEAALDRSPALRAVARKAFETAAAITEKSR